MITTEDNRRDSLEPIQMHSSEEVECSKGASKSPRRPPPCIFVNNHFSACRTEEKGVESDCSALLLTDDLISKVRASLKAGAIMRGNYQSVMLKRRHLSSKQNMLSLRARELRIAKETSWRLRETNRGHDNIDSELADIDRASDLIDEKQRQLDEKLLRIYEERLRAQEILDDVLESLLPGPESLNVSMESTDLPIVLDISPCSPLAPTWPFQTPSISAAMSGNNSLDIIAS